ncbi:MAG: hypothetical protein EBX52_07745 [Proteobacteria bacterium]|nr:hypothetical protein [Pseudomonadota bacterium]
MIHESEIVEENGQPVEKQILIGADELRTARISPGSKKRFKISGNRPPAGGINKPPGRFSPWTMNSATSSLPLKDTDFLPPDYLKRLSDAGGKVTVTTIPSGGQYGGFDVSIDLALNGEKQNLIRFSVEGRSDRSSVQVENLRLSSPDALEPKGRLRSAQEKKGLPADVGRFFSRQLFEFLQAGSYKNIVVEGTTDYLVWKTYQMNGAKPAYPEGVKMTAYLDEIYKSKNPALAEHLTSVSDFANLTNPVRSLKSVSDHNLFSTIESEWKSLQAQGKESSSTISPIRDSKGTTIGFDYKVPDGTKKTFLIAPFLPDHPIIDWAHLWMTNPRAVTLNKSLR